MALTNAPDCNRYQRLSSLQAWCCANRDCATARTLHHYVRARAGGLLAGFAAGSRENANRSELTQFISTTRVRVVASTAATADLYALVYAALRRKGQPIPTNDIWIAASCLEHGAALLTLDAHFQAIDGLRAGQQLGDFIP